MLQSSKKYFVTLLASATGLYLSAQEASSNTAVATATPSADNTLLYLLLAACTVLLVAALLLGNVWLKLAKLAFDKRAKKTTTIILLLFAGHALLAQEAAALAPVAEKGHSFSFNINVAMGVFVLAVELLVIIWMLIAINKLLSELASEQATPNKPFAFHLPRLFDNLNASVAVENEEDIKLHHNYDGIFELDNSLPPWWKYSFYLSIVWSVGYLGYYFVGGGASSIDEYKAEVQQANVQIEEYKKKNALNVDENNVQYADAAGITDGMDIYKTNCAACHGNAGEGVVGPNLTDDYWLHGGTANDVYKSVKYGWPAKGMKSWEADLSAVQIKNVISYIHSIHGTNPPNAKAPQGDLATGSDGGAKADSTAIAAVGTEKK